MPLSHWPGRAPPAEQDSGTRYSTKGGSTCLIGIDSQAGMAFVGDSPVLELIVWQQPVCLLGDRMHSLFGVGRLGPPCLCFIQDAWKSWPVSAQGREDLHPR